MNELEHELHYPLGDKLPAPATTIELAPGVRWLRMPLPFALDHINLWLLRDRIDGRDGWTVVDCGVSRDEVQALWEQIFEKELQGLPILRVIVTHMHPDHIGLAYWLTERWQAPLQMTMTDYAIAQLNLTGSSMAGGDRVADHFERHGMADAGALEAVRSRGGYYQRMVPRVPPSFVRILDGDTVRIGGHDWHVIVGYGHAPEHASLHCPALNVLISGDMVLPRISTNIAVHANEPEGNPLQAYLDSLDRYRALPADTLVLPSHGRPFVGLHTRVDQQHGHHAGHLERVLQACGNGPQSAADIIPVLFRRKLDAHQLTFAVGEAIAHLHMLYYQGRLARRTGNDGVIRFAAVG
ncbi:MBL fold metallo-hydrolase [Pigmentiphaga soli]|uniref:MBL fold metallo-hydrolase n=1 Tax=Pigmentiphaga soli TaxID=1007095 RepID=A0ABP8GHJ8_9BURK